MTSSHTGTPSAMAAGTEPWSPDPGRALPGPERFALLAAGAAAADRPDTVQRLRVEAPATGELLGEVPRSGPEQVAAVALRARTAQRAWARTPVRERTAALRRFADLVLDRQDEILDIIQLENGKARQDAFEEVLDVAQVCRYYATNAPRLLRRRRRTGAIPALTVTHELHHPKGLVGIISPWNYPLTLGVTDALPALAAGNAVLTKPDEQTPFATLWAAGLLLEAGLPEGLFAVVTGIGSELGESIINESDFLMFTGSTQVGRMLAAHAGERLIDYSMELGGKNALLVLDDADLAKAVPGAVHASFANAGQLCVSAERLYIDARRWDEFVPRFIEATTGLRLGHSLDYGNDVGPLASARQLQTVERHVSNAVSKGATVLAGGRVRKDMGPTFYEPTVLTGVTPEMDVYADETFGPVVSLYRVEGADEAIALANGSPYGLSASVWTSDPKRARQVAARLASGNVNINEGYAATWGSMDAPMGGWKDSGAGSRHGEYGLLKYTDAQNVARQRGFPLSRPAGMAVDRYTRLMTTMTRLLGRIPGKS